MTVTSKTPGQNLDYRAQKTVRFYAAINISSELSFIFLPDD